MCRYVTIDKAASKKVKIRQGKVTRVYINGDDVGYVLRWGRGGGG